MKKLLLFVLIGLCICATTQKAGAQMWKPLGQGFEQIPVAITSTPEYMYFAFADSTTSSNKTKIFGFARWNGFFWQNMDTLFCGPDSYITSLAWYKDKLFVAGFFDTVYTISSRTGIITRDQFKWSNAAPRKKDDFSPLRINDLQVFENVLYAAGNFTRIDTTRAFALAKYTGSAWEAAENFKSNSIYGGVAYNLEIYNDTLFMCGYFSRIQQSIAAPVFKIKGNATIADTTSPFLLVNHLQGSSGEMMAVGIDQNQNKIIYTYKNGGWRASMKGFPNLQTSSIGDIEFFNGEFWASGYIDLGGGQSNSLIRWKDSAWQLMEKLNLSSVKFVKNFRNRLFVTGGFTFFRKLPLNRVAEYDENFALISGRVFWDRNNNCKKDPLEPFLKDQVIKLLNGYQVAITDKDGAYHFYVLKQGINTVSPMLKKYWTVTPCTQQYTYNLNSGELLFDSADFALKLDINIEDVSIKISPNAGLKMRRGFTELYTLTYKNNGGKTIPAGNIELKFDNSFGNFTAIPPPTSQVGNKATWNFSSLEPDMERTIYFKGKVNNGQTQEISMHATVSSMNDANEGDNYDSLTQTVADTTDLSGKSIFPEPSAGDTVTIFSQNGSSGHEITYLIRFENTTPNYVNTVMVFDTIDLNLDIEYIQELGASHPYTTQVVNLPPQLGKGVLIWTFSNINLPPNVGNNNDFTDNRGHISFKMKMNDKTQPGVIVKNKADIIYDYSLPAATNHVYCMLDKLKSIAPANISNTGGVWIYPNPANTQLTIVPGNTTSYTITVSDIQGRVCLPTQKFTGDAAQLDVSSLLPGIYFLTLTSGNETIHQKFVKE